MKQKIEETEVRSPIKMRNIIKYPRGETKQYDIIAIIQMQIDLLYSKAHGSFGKKVIFPKVNLYPYEPVAFDCFFRI